MFGVVSDLSKDVGATIPGAKEIAWRMTAHALKENMKEMYQGELIVMGDPSTKPYDRMYIQDIYENMQGECEIESVVHSFNANSGYTTSLYADCISAVDDRYERYNQMISRSIVFTVGAIMGPVFIANTFAARFNFISKNIAKKVMQGGSSITKHLINICKLIDKDPKAVVSATLKGSASIANAILPTSATQYYDILIKSYDTLGDKLKGLEKIESIDDIITFLSNNGSAIKKLDVDDLYTTFEALSTNTTLSPDDLLELKTELSAFGIQFQSSVQQSIDFGDDFYVALRELSDNIYYVAKEASDAQNAIEGIEDIVKILDKVVDTKNIQSADEMIELAAALARSKELTTSADLIADVVTSAKVIKSLDTIGDAAKGFKGAITKLQTVINGTLAMSGPAGWAVTVVKFLAEATISFLIGAYSCEAVERYLQNLQVLQIYPLTKNGYVLTAGIVGHRGLVIGSPTEKTQGVWTNYVADMFGAAPPSDLVSGIAQLFFTNERTRQIASGLKAKNELPDPLSSTFDAQKAISTLNKDIAKTYAKYSLKNETYLFKIDRCKTQEELSSALPQYYVKSDSTGLITTKTGEELVPIQEDTAINQLVQKRIVMLFNNIKNETQITGIFGGKTIQLMCDVQDNNLYNVPILRPEAVAILRDICTAYCTEMGYSDQMDETTLDDILENSLTINSATIIDEEAYEGTGLCFKINMLNNSEDSVLSKVMEAIDTAYNSDKDFPNVFIERDQNTNEYAVCVNPIPKKGDQ